MGPEAHNTHAFDPLALTGREHADRAREAGIPGRAHTAIRRHRAFLRKADVHPREASYLDLSSVKPIDRLEVSDSSEGEVRKFVLRVPARRPDATVSDSTRAGDARPDARELETESVLIPMIGRKRRLTHTLCVSSQVGCAMGCDFCQTAQLGLVRDLAPQEIVAQWWAARHELGCETITNLVFMGMGEPMDNLESVIRAIELLTDHDGPAMTMQKITISTVGRVDGIRRLAEQVRRPGWRRLGLAVSLNAPNDDVRDGLMPVNRRYPLDELRGAIEQWPVFGGAKICFEYVLIPGVNDEREHATQLADFVQGRGAYAGRPKLGGVVNVIPYNPREDSPWPAPSEESVELFVAAMHDEGVFVKRRRTKGRDTMAACGQLGNRGLARRPRRGATPLTIGDAAPASHESDG